MNAGIKKQLSIVFLFDTIDSNDVTVYSIYVTVKSNKFPELHFSGLREE